MVKELFIDIMNKILDHEDMVEIKHGHFFVTKFDPKTQTFKKLIFDESNNNWTYEDITDKNE